MAVRCGGFENYNLVAELKRAHYRIVNALDGEIWDAFRVAHATATLDGVFDGLLVYLAPVKAWREPARFAQLYHAPGIRYAPYIRALVEAIRSAAKAGEI